jgi:tRNA G18 (ribose-2'-O)-methylase SpoU
MPVLAITDPDDPRVADYRAIPDPELVRRRGLFVAEGRLVVRRLLEQRRLDAQSVLVTRPALADIEDALAARPDLAAYVAEPPVLVAIGGFNFHRGCLGIGRRPAAEPLAQAPLDGVRRIVALEGLAQADNVGSVFRNAAAFGVELVLIGPKCCDPLYRKALRTSMGAALAIPYVHAVDWPRDLERLRTEGFRVLALTPRAAVAIADEAARHAGERVALLVGAEGTGLSAAAIDASDECVRIPMAAGVDSLNVATATGIALHRLWGDRSGVVIETRTTDPQ